MDEEGTRRSELRESVYLRASIRDELVELPVTVRNISPRGAMIQGAEVAQVGTEVSLELPNIGRVLGIVAWRRGDLCGIRFNHPINHRDARRQVTSESFGRASALVLPPKRTV
jgi:hypothetical protein